MLRIDFNIVFMVINLLILYAILHRFLLKPVREILKQRSDEIAVSYQNAAQATQAANELKRQYEDVMSHVETEKAEKLASTRLAASREYDEILKNANEKAEKIVQEAKKEAEVQAEKRRHEMQEEMAVLVAQAAYKIAAQKDSQENDRKLYDTFLGDTGKKED